MTLSLFNVEMKIAFPKKMNALKYIRWKKWVVGRHKFYNSQTQNYIVFNRIKKIVLMLHKE